MKNFIAVLIVFLINISCAKDESDGNKFVGTIVDEEFTIKNSGVVNYYLGDIGADDIARVTTEPKHQSVSLLDGSQYTYEPEDDFIGKDYVELFTSQRDTLPNGNNVSKNTKIRITIYVTE